MSREKTKEELILHKERAIKHLDNYLEALIKSDVTALNGKADKISYWLKDWTTFLDFEAKFSPASLRRYKRGEIIKVHLGFNVGSEEGGLHYAVVLDKNNSKKSPVVTVAPLTSVKQNTDVTNLRGGNVFLGNELFTNLNAKVSSMHRSLSTELQKMRDFLSDPNFQEEHEETYAVMNQLNSLKEDVELLKKMQSEIRKMRIGSIALVNQITTISKIRIYDPKTDHDILSGIKLSNEKLDLIDNEIKQNFTGL